MGPRLDRRRGGRNLGQALLFLACVCRQTHVDSQARRKFPDNPAERETWIDFVDVEGDSVVYPFRRMSGASMLEDSHRGDRQRVGAVLVLVNNEVFKCFLAPHYQKEYWDIAYANSLLQPIGFSHDFPFFQDLHLADQSSDFVGNVAGDLLAPGEYTITLKVFHLIHIGASSVLDLDDIQLTSIESEPRQLRTRAKDCDVPARRQVLQREMDTRGEDNTNIKNHQILKKVDRVILVVRVVKTAFLTLPGDCPRKGTVTDTETIGLSAQETTCCTQNVALKRS